MTTSGGVREITLSKGFVTIVDVADFDWLSAWKWSVACSRGHFYAARAIKVGGRKGRCFGFKMHREIVAPGPGLIVDHINGDGLDNRRANLRICTQAENTRNRSASLGTLSGYKGVKKLGDRWQARICVGRHMRYLGTFDTAEEAARVYDAAVPLYHGEFGRPNFLPGQDHAPSTCGVSRRERSA